MRDGWRDDFRLLTAREVAQRAGVNVVTLRRWVVKGRFPSRPDGSEAVVRTPGGQLRFYPDAVDREFPRE